VRKTGFLLHQGRLQAFTAIGRVADGEPYAFDMGSGFAPFRRNVEWAEAKDAPIRPLLNILEFAAGKTSWGYQLRFGLVELSRHDMKQIATAMQVAF
jgi:hypothetical protein